MSLADRLPSQVGGGGDDLKRLKGWLAARRKPLAIRKLFRTAT